MAQAQASSNTQRKELCRAQKRVKGKNTDSNYFYLTPLSSSSSGFLHDLAGKAEHITNLLKYSIITKSTTDSNGLSSLKALTI